MFMTERFETLDQREFRTVGELHEILREWLTDPGFAGLDQGYVESSNDLRLITLVSERLSDGFYVYGVRLDRDSSDRSLQSAF